MTSPLRCAYAACKEQANVTEDGYDFCSVHAARQRLEAAAAAQSLTEQLRGGSGRPEAAAAPPPGAARLRSLLLLPVDNVDPHPLNIRDSVGDLRDLVDSIRSVGILEPLVAVPTDGRHRLIAGHRRLAAAREAGLTHVPVVVREDLTEEQVVEAMLIENMQRVDLTPLEEARALRGLVDLGRTQTAVAKAIGKHKHWVGRRLLLLDLPTDLQGRLTAKEISLAEAEALAAHLRSHGTIADRGWDKPHLCHTHTLASVAASRCTDNGHHLRRRVGRVACGQCWEDAIREDEQQRHAGTVSEDEVLDAGRAAVEQHQPDGTGGCTCGFCAWSVTHVLVMAVGETLSRPHNAEECVSTGSVYSLDYAWPRNRVIVHVDRELSPQEALNLADSLRYFAHRAECSGNPEASLPICPVCGAYADLPSTRACAGEHPPTSVPTVAPYDAAAQEADQ